MRKAVLALLLLIAHSAFAAERGKLDSITWEAGIVLAFKVSDAAVQKALPDGWQVDSSTVGVTKGYNLRLSFVDHLLSKDAYGRSRLAVHGISLAVPAKKQGMETSALMVIGGMFSPASYAPGPYGNYIPAKTDIERKVHNDPSGLVNGDESWSITSDAGDIVQLQLQYKRGILSRNKSDFPVYSAVRPDPYVNQYHVDLLYDVIRSTATGINETQKVEFKASGPQLARFFDGSEQLITIFVIPASTREVYLPSSNDLSGLGDEGDHPPVTTEPINPARNP